MVSNSIYGVINPDILQMEHRRQHHNAQMANTYDCAKKLEEFMESACKVEPAYQQMAYEQCLLAICRFMGEHNQMI